MAKQHPTRAQAPSLRLTWQRAPHADFAFGTREGLIAAGLLTAEQFDQLTPRGQRGKPAPAILTAEGCTLRLEPEGRGRWCLHVELAPAEADRRRDLVRRWQLARNYATPEGVAQAVARALLTADATIMDTLSGAAALVKGGMREAPAFAYDAATQRDVKRLLDAIKLRVAAGRVSIRPQEDLARCRTQDELFARPPRSSGGAAVVPLRVGVAAAGAQP